MLVAVAIVREVKNDYDNQIRSWTMIPVRMQVIQQQQQQQQQQQSSPWSSLVKSESPHGLRGNRLITNKIYCQNLIHSFSRY